MKQMLMVFLLLFLLQGQATALLPEELVQAGDPELADLVQQTELSLPELLRQGIAQLWQEVAPRIGQMLRESLAGMVRILAVVMLCSLAEGAYSAAREGGGKSYIRLTGGLVITRLTIGEIGSFIALGTETIQQMNGFSKLLLPSLTAAAMAAGEVTSAAARQVGTVFFLDLLLTAAERLLLPLLQLYLGALTAGVLLEGGSLKSVAAGIKKAVTWLLSALLVVFLTYMTLSSGISGSADAMAVKATKLVMGGMLPVVGSIISDASETVLVGAGMLRNSIGLFGMLCVIGICLLPFLRLGIQYLLYKCAAFAALTAGESPLVTLIEGYSGAFALLLGLTGSCALLLFISTVSAVSAVGI